MSIIRASLGRFQALLRNAAPKPRRLRALRRLILGPASPPNTWLLAPYLALQPAKARKR